MRHSLHLVVLNAALAATAAHAQIINPDKLVAPAPPNPARHYEQRHKHDLQWLWQYTLDGSAAETGLLADPRFKQLISNELQAPQAFWNNGLTALPEVVTHYFTVELDPKHVAHSDNRYISIRGCVPHDCPRQGLLWFDTEPRHADIIFAATEWSSVGHEETSPDAQYNLWLFSNRALDPDHLSEAFLRTASRWLAGTHENILKIVLVDPDGTPHAVDPRVFTSTSTSQSN